MKTIWSAPPQESLPNKKPPVLFLPGWGFSGQVLELADKQCSWASPSASLDPATALSEIFAFLSQYHLETIHLVGWSLGAFLAFDCACAFPEKVTGLTLMGMRASWPSSEIEAIRQGLATDPQAFLRDFYRKSFLGYKKESRRFVAEQQEALLESLDMQVLGRGLDYLAQWRLPAQVPQCPVSCWHGRRDIIAPMAEQAMIPGARTTIIEHGGHALFLDREFVLGE
ncbi:MAG: alpha/beta hydrolase [Deltaproteobacteria bacterium]|nr:alpha/beta hydrolase [Deltaproteobacteria bacterium]